MKFLWESLVELSPSSEYSGGTTYDSIICIKGVKPSLEDVEIKNAELEAAEPMRLLRLERDILLQQTDWRFRIDQEPSQAWYEYCQELRDLPANSEPQLDEFGNLTNVNWPTPPEN